MKIRAIAPASFGEMPQFEKLKETLSPEIQFATTYHPVPFHSNTDQERFAELQRALSDPLVDVLWCLRGGYGCARLLPMLAKIPKPSQPKILIGYSDITFLHLFWQKWGFPAIHGAMLFEAISQTKNKRNIQLIHQWLKGPQKVIYHGLTPINVSAKMEKNIEGKLIGGNLTLITNSFATPWAIQAKGAILFLEDVHCKGYEIDRMLVHLKQAGILCDVRAIILGTFSCGDDMVTYALERFIKETDVPTYRCDWIGHSTDNNPLLIGAEACIQLQTNFKASLTFNVNF